MIKKIIKFIHELRILFLILIIFGFFGVIGINPINVSQFFGAKLGEAVGMSVSVPENPFNKLALQLEEKENSLNVREVELQKREQNLDSGGVPIDGQKNVIVLLMVGIIVLFILVLVNYYLDYQRRKTDNKNRGVNR